MSAAPVSEVARPTMVDPTTLVLGENVRREVQVDVPFKRDIAARGVRQPVEVRRDPMDQLVVIDGQRRTLAAIEAGVQVPVFIVDDIADDADRIFEQLGANGHRAGISKADHVSAVQQLFRLPGMTVAKIAKRTQLPKDEIDAALTVAEAGAFTRARLAEHDDLDLVTQAKVAAVAGADDELAAELAEEIAGDPERADHAIERVRRARAEREAVANRARELRAQGVNVLGERPETYTPGAKAEHLVRLTDKPRANGNGPELDVTEHQMSCPGHAAYVYVWSLGEVREDVYCLSWREHGHYNRYARNTAGATSGAAPEEQSAARRQVVANGKAADAAQSVRRAFIGERFANRAVKPTDVEVQHAALMIACGRPDEYGVSVALREILGDASADLAKVGTIRRTPDAGKRYLLVLAMALGEHALSVTRGKESWWASPATDSYGGNPNLGGTHLRFLADAGYGLSELEQTWLDAYETKEA
ncbi:ParB/RepB/Spo0J family partition protein [Isoptericola sp. QY 916]|uniref:ParB/RepB/Spo0J family partition protein n=1 Tax=Isoptericola sp. QY 916 TaxID=2782570 RepID=UPI003D300022|nr:ParB/RepB/Spo0J family partition protein [Isoptericola sp. QY 916]